MLHVSASQEAPPVHEPLPVHAIVQLPDPPVHDTPAPQASSWVQPMVQSSAVQLTLLGQAWYRQSTSHALPAQSISPWHDPFPVQSMSQLRAAEQSMDAQSSDWSQTTWQSRRGGHTIGSGQPEPQSKVQTSPTQVAGSGQVVSLQGRGPASVGPSSPASGLPASSPGVPESPPASGSAASAEPPSVPPSTRGPESGSSRSPAVSRLQPHDRRPSTTPR